MKRGGQAEGAKGAGLASIRRWTASQLGAPAVEAIEQRLSESAAATWGRPLASGWYPIEHVNEYLTAIAEVGGFATREMQERRFSDLGRFVAEDNLSTVYSFLLRLANPSSLPKMMPMLWGTYFKGADVSVDETPPGNTAIVTVAHLPIPFIRPMAYGWFRFAFEKVGAESCTITEKSWEAGLPSADPMEYHMSWS